MSRIYIGTIINVKSENKIRIFVHKDIFSLPTLINKFLIEENIKKHGIDEIEVSNYTVNGIEFPDEISKKFIFYLNKKSFTEISTAYNIIEFLN